MVPVANFIMMNINPSFLFQIEAWEGGNQFDQNIYTTPTLRIDVKSDNCINLT